MAKDSENEGKVMGKGDFANMPQDVMMKAYPRAKQFGPTDLNDTITGIDESNSRSDSRARAHVSNQH